MQYILEIKDKLKELKKQLNIKFKDCYNQLLKTEEYTAKLTALRTGYITGLGLTEFKKQEIEAAMPLVQKSIRYCSQIAKLEPLLKECNIQFELPKISFKKYLKDGFGVAEANGENAIIFLKEEEKLSIEDNLADLMERSITVPNNSWKVICNIAKINLNFYIFVWTLEYHLLDITKIIDSLDNDKIKAPINDISRLYCLLTMLNISVDKISKFLGLAITFNKEYAIKNPNHNIKDIDLINKLAEFYNPNGTFKPNSSNEEFNSLLSTLIEKGQKYFNLLSTLYYLLSSITDFNYNINFNRYENTYNKIKNLHEQAKDSEPELVKKDVTPKILNYKNTIDRDFYKYLALFFDSKNDRIIAIPANLEEFYQRLAESNLTPSRKKHIRKLMKETINQIDKNIRFKHLTNDQLVIYNRATKLLDTLESFNPDNWELTQILREINDILDILNTNISNNDRQELLRDLSNYIENLELICIKYITNNHIKKLKPYY